jgi:hypothetical protein
MKKIIIFCQAPLDLIYVLWLYEKNKAISCIDIYVVGVQANYEFLLSLGLTGCNIRFIPLLSFKSPINIVTTRYRLSSVYQSDFAQINNATVFFFSNYCDYATMYFVNKLHSNNKVIFIDHYDIRSQKRFRISFLNWLKRNIIKFVSGLDCYFSLEKNFVTFNAETFEKLRINVWNDKCLLEKYLVKVDVDGKKSAIIFDGNDQAEEQYLNYTSLVSDIVKFIADNGYVVFIKPHPRMGCSKVFYKLPVTVLSQSYPAEFLDAKQFDIVLGGTSLALIKFFHEKNGGVFSYLELIEFKRQNEKNEYRKYLQRMTDGKIKFIHDIREIIPCKQEGF